MIQGLKQQPIALIITYILVGLGGLVLAIVVEFGLVLKLSVVFLSGFLVGISGEKLAR